MRQMQRGGESRGMSREMKMQRVRAQVKLVHRLQEQLQQMAPGARSPVITDMPRYTGALAQGLDAQMARKDALERMIYRESALLRKYERAARAEMDAMTPGMYAFCTMYYLSGLSLEKAGEMIGKSERQCRRYKKEIEGEERTARMTENGRKRRVDSMVSGVI